MVDPLSFASVSSTVGNGKCSRLTLALSFFRSTHTRTLPFGFNTGTIGAHQSVGCSTFVITPSVSIRSSSRRTLRRIWMGTLRALTQLYGFASGRSSIFTGSPSMQPRAGLAVDTPMWPRWTRPILCEVWRLSRLTPPVAMTRSVMEYETPCRVASVLNSPSMSSFLPSAPVT